MILKSMLVMSLFLQPVGAPAVPPTGAPPLVSQAIDGNFSALILEASDDGLLVQVGDVAAGEFPGEQLLVQGDTWGYAEGERVQIFYLNTPQEGVVEAVLIELLSANGDAAVPGEMIVRVDPSFDGQLSAQLQEIGISAIEEIFNVGDTVLYLFHFEGEFLPTQQALEALPFVHYSEPNQIMSLDLPTRQSEEFNAIIIEINGRTAIVEPLAGESIRASGDRVSIPLPSDDFALYDAITVSHTGMVMESYPLQVDVISVVHMTAMQAQ